MVTLIAFATESQVGWNQYSIKPTRPSHLSKPKGVKISPDNIISKAVRRCGGEGGIRIIADSLYLV